MFFIFKIVFHFKSTLGVLNNENDFNGNWRGLQVVFFRKYVKVVDAELVAQREAYHIPLPFDQ